MTHAPLTQLALVPVESRMSRDARGGRLVGVGRRFIFGLVALLAGSTVASVSVRAEDRALDAKPSTYAAVTDLVSQVDEIREALEKDVNTDSEYSESKQTRVARTANTLVVVAQLIGMHDEDCKYKAAAPTLVKLSRELCAAADDQAKAGAAYKQLAAALDDPQPSDEKMEWKALADIQMLMEHVPSLNSKLRRGMTKSRFEKQAAETLSYAAAIAAVAQASAYDNTYCSGAEDEKAWQEMCMEYRGAMADLANAVRKSSLDDAKTAMERSSESCNTCHERFREEE